MFSFKQNENAINSLHEVYGRVLMRDGKYTFRLSLATWVIIICAAAKFVLHMYIAPGYGFFFDELYTIALSRHLAFGNARPRTGLKPITNPCF